MLKPLDISVLKSLPLLEGVSDEALREVLPLFHRKSFPADARIITAEQPGEVAYFVLEGSLKVVGEEGERDVIVALRGPGEVVGEMSLIDGEGRSATIVTSEPSTLLWIDRNDFWARLWKVEPVALNLTKMLSRRLRLCTTQMQALAALDVNGRVARQLLAFAREYGEPNGSEVLIPVRLTQTELADMVGASRVRVNQVLAYFRKRRFIAVDDRHRITVLDAAQLENCCR